MRPADITLLVFLIVAPSLSCVQRQNHQELIEASLGTRFGYESQPVSVVSLESLAPAPCIPAGASLVGGYRQGESATWVYRVATNGAEALEACRADLRAEGFIREYEISGLVDRPFYSRLCRDDKFVMLAVSRGHSSWYLSETYPESAGKCENLEIFHVGFSIELPDLAPPNGAVSQNLSSHSSSIDRDYSAFQRIRTATVKPELLDHYSQQLVSHGWMAGTEVIHESIAVAIASKRIDDGVGGIELRGAGLPNAHRDLGSCGVWCVGSNRDGPSVPGRRMRNPMLQLWTISPD